MKVVILAAGKGSRLDNSVGHLPKALTLLSNGQSILEYQLDALTLDQVIVVVGYQKEVIKKRFPHLNYVDNDAYAQENTSKSLLKAIEYLDDDVLWLNGDVIFRHSSLDHIWQLDRTCMLVNQTEVGDEEVKYRAVDRKILEVSKEVKDPQGEALGINFFKKQDLTALKNGLRVCQPMDYFEKGIEAAIQTGVEVWAVPVEVNDCTEIDFPEDLIRANQLLRTWDVD